MPHTRSTGELARARLDLPITIRTTGTRRRRTARAVEASIISDRTGALMVTMRTEPPSEICTMPLLGYLQFIGRFETAVDDVLTSAS